MSKLQARNEAIINAPIGSVWAIITDIHLLQKVNPGVLKVSGRMDRQGETRTCEMKNGGKIGTMTEKLIELVPEQKTVWAIENDTMGISKMLKETRFCFYLEKLGDSKTKITNESYYDPANLMVKIMNTLMMKRKMGQIQAQILSNIKSIAEK
ncbi:MAG TPA: SRPBCC family protein [Saprospiraceae bacterium]|nr:SRPBCC family protein [Saprospiraceae bacterium]